jgi:hypothetical protein
LTLRAYLWHQHRVGPIGMESGRSSFKKKNQNKFLCCLSFFLFLHCIWSCGFRRFIQMSAAPPPSISFSFSRSSFLNDSVLWRRRGRLFCGRSSGGGSGAAAVRVVKNGVPILSDPSAGWLLWIFILSCMEQQSCRLPIEIPSSIFCYNQELDWICFCIWYR